MTIVEQIADPLEQSFLSDSATVCWKDINSSLGFAISFFYRFCSVVQYLLTSCFSTLILYCWASKRL